MRIPDNTDPRTLGMPFIAIPGVPASLGGFEWPEWGILALPLSEEERGELAQDGAVMLHLLHPEAIVGWDGTWRGWQQRQVHADPLLVVLQPHAPWEPSGN